MALVAGRVCKKFGTLDGIKEILLKKKIGFLALA